MSKRWQLQEAKNRFSEVVERALHEGPQTVTRHGKDVVVIVANETFQSRQASRLARGSLLTFLRGLEFSRVKLKVDRSRDGDRDFEL